MTPIQWTWLNDKNGRPIAVGDLIRVYHFRAANHRNVWMYKKILVRDGKPAAYEVGDLGQKPMHECHSYQLYPNDAAQSEIIDGPCARTDSGGLVCWWERPKVKQETKP